MELSGSKWWVSEAHVKSVLEPNKTGGRRSMEKRIQKTPILQNTQSNPSLYVKKKNQLAETIDILFKSHGQDLAK